MSKKSKKIQKIIEIILDLFETIANKYILISIEINFDPLLAMN